jgi:SAM-dependent methyltransferase
MGISRATARMTLEEASKRPFSGSVLQLGRQAMWMPMDELKKLMALHEVPLGNADAIAKNAVKALFEPFIDDGTYFAALGFSDVQSCDVSNFEQVNHIFDLNYQVPTELHGKYDLVYDGGTLEHIFHQPNALNNIHKLLKIGGRAIHAVPTSNHVDHGFYCFSPTFFYDYYKANGYEILTSYLYEHTVRHDTEIWNIYDYKPGSIDHLSFGGFNNGKMLGVFFVVQKTSSSTGDIIPQQGFYRTAWAKSDLSSTAASAVAVENRPFTFPLQKQIKFILNATGLLHLALDLRYRSRNKRLQRKLKQELEQRLERSLVARY